MVVEAGRASVVTGRTADQVAEWSEEPTVTVVADAVAFSRLVGARRDPAELVASGRVAVAGDPVLGQRLLDGLGYMI